MCITNLLYNYIHNMRAGILYLYRVSLLILLMVLPCLMLLGLVYSDGQIVQDHLLHTNIYTCSNTFQSSVHIQMYTVHVRTCICNTVLSLILHNICIKSINTLHEHVHVCTWCYYESSSVTLWVWQYIHTVHITYANSVHVYTV